ncbi:MAG TPA: TonB-dependent receptor [Chitinophagaceae bacterium]|jgi:iron complex outermembrane receptor protein/outer membrane receptor for ferrienterochelin and colicins|nr:TonB-dependent receptor [Chitinophagaceae bacterium]
MGRCLFIALFFFVTGGLYGQEQVKIKLVDSVTRQPIPVVTVSVKNNSIVATDSTGMATISLATGNNLVSFSSVGYSSKQVLIAAPASAVIQVFLIPEEKTLDDVTVVSSTRNNQRIENSPLKVEVLGREEMDEENTIKPASIASILGDVSGVQIQQSGSISGNANVRIQGLEGRYTQVLRDGMPLFDGFSGGFGILSIPPLDLKQVELIKGAASTLYGGGAIGGLINIISRRPATRQDITITLNQTTLKESNANIYIAKRNKHVGYNFFGGYTRQKAVDVNDDGFSDVGKMDALAIHPRLFFYPDEKTTIITGYTAVLEGRLGGDMQVVKDKADVQHQYFEKNKTQRYSGELMIEKRMSGNKKAEIKAGLSSFTRSVTTNTHYFNGRQFNYFTELSLLVPYGDNSLVAGINLLGDDFKKLPSDPLQLNNFSNRTMGIFVQNTWQFNKNTLLEAGIRDDHHNRYGNFILPRLAFFNRFNEHWATRLGIGFGYKTPNPLAVQLFDYAIENIQPIAAPVKAERSVGYNAEINYKKEWDNDNEVFINHAFFLTQVNNPVIATEQLNGNVSFSNALRPVVTKGFDTYIQAKLQGWELYTGYTFTIAKRKYLQQDQFMPLTPKNRMAFTIVKELGENWRVGLEGSYNGLQYRQDATKTPDYFFMAGLIERKFGTHISVILNGENLLDYRQSKNEPLFKGSVTNPSFVPLWAPIDGRVINLAVRIKL